MRLDINKKIIRNAYIPHYGSTVETDIIMITEYGIFVIESKNYSGWIFGSEYNRYWTQMLNKNSKYKFYNPIAQNRTHIKALSDHLNIHPSYFRSCIVFSNNAELKKIPADTEYFCILYDHKLYRYLNNIAANGSKIILAEDIEKIYNKLLPLTKVPYKEKIRHIE